MGMANEFKTFIARGNVIDMAVGIIMGAAFTTIVKSLVDDVIMPPIGMLTGGVDFTNLFINLGDGEFDSLKAAQEAGAATINYGVFLNAVLSFLIVAFVVFMLVKQVNRLKDMAKKEEAEEVKEEAAPEPSNEEKLLAEIRDLLKTQQSS